MSMLWKLRPDFSALKDLGLKQSDLIATVRPPATEAHYHNPESELLFERFMERVSTVEGAKVVLLPRNRKQGDFIRAQWPHWFIDDRTIIPAKALDGLNLIFNSDLVVSGGGTMNREAAALRYPRLQHFSWENRRRRSKPERRRTLGLDQIGRGCRGQDTFG